MDAQAIDREMMQRCIALSIRSGQEGEYPYGVVISRNGTVVAESINRVRHERDVTRHAEVVAISAAQKALGTVSLDDCTIYVSAESCAYCCYAIRESRIGRVVFGLRSPHMGGVSKWPILPDEDLSNTMPEVFAAPPEIIAGFMADEAEEALLKFNPVSGGVMKLRGLFVKGPVETIGSVDARRRSLQERTFAFLRRAVFDRFGRR
jgi:tRNA(adenine34) deaminase